MPNLAIYEKFSKQQSVQTENFTSINVTLKVQEEPQETVETKEDKKCC
jgi:hypothetical protein